MSDSPLNRKFLPFPDAVADLLASGYRLRFRATGRSMHPVIAEGEMITVESIAADDIRLGDIVLYRKRKSVIAHRVEKIGRGLNRVNYLLLRGDAAESCDDPVLPEQVLARVVAVDRQGRKVAVSGPRGKLRQRLRSYATWIKRSLRGLSP